MGRGSAAASPLAFVFTASTQPRGASAADRVHKAGRPWIRRAGPMSRGISIVPPLARRAVMPVAGRMVSGRRLRNAVQRRYCPGPAYVHALRNDAGEGGDAARALVTSTAISPDRAAPPPVPASGAREALTASQRHEGRICLPRQGQSA